MIDISTRLRSAIYNKNILVVRRILSTHPRRVLNPDIVSNTSLHLAASTNALEIVEYLVDVANHEVGDISRNRDGDTALMHACAANAVDVVRFLARRFPHIVGWKNKAGVTGLMMAAMAGHEGVVAVLLELEREGALDLELDAVDACGNTALHYASAWGHLKTIRTLIEAGAGTHIQNRLGWTAEQFSHSFQAEQYFKQLVAEQESRELRPTVSNPVRAATPVLGRSERAFDFTSGRARASSGS